MEKMIIQSVEGGMTDAQISALVMNVQKIFDHFRAELPASAVEQMVGNLEVLFDMYVAFRKSVEAATNTILRQVTSDGRRGESLFAVLKSSGHMITGSAKEAIQSQQFVVTFLKNYLLVIVRGDDFPSDERTTGRIRAEAEKCRFSAPPAEVATLLRMEISNDELVEMGFLSLVVMHEPISTSETFLDLLGFNSYDEGSWFSTFNGEPDYKWGHHVGFVFLVRMQ